MYSSRRLGISWSIAVMLLLLTILPDYALGDEFNPGAYAINSEVEGYSYEQVSIAFWQWVYGTSANGHPLLDETGDDCAVNQGDFPVFFLIFSGGGHAVRSCQVPEGIPILVPINVVVCTFAELDVETEEELHTCAEEDESSDPGLFLSVDGREFVQLEDYRVHTSAFELNIPSDPIIAEPGPTVGVSDGYWIILEPLPVGKHEVHFKASLSNPVTGVLFYNDDVLYHLEVVAPSDSSQYLLASSTASGNFMVELLWTPNHIGEANMFEITIMDSGANILEEASYDIVLYQGGQRLDETLRVAQITSEQEYVLPEADSYEIRIENINGSGAGDYISLPVEYTPEFPLGLLVLLGSTLCVIIGVARFRGFSKNFSSG